MTAHRMVAGDGLPLDPAGHALEAVHDRSQGAHLVALDRAEVVPRQRTGPWVGGKGLGLAQELLGVVLPTTWRPLASAARTASGPNPLVTASR